jgi:outer membrane protein TolC
MMMSLSLLVLLGGVSSQLIETLPKASGPDLTTDPVLVGLIRQAMEKRPELASGRAQIAALVEREPQVAVLPDPILSVGIQNDGFNEIQIGKMDTSYVQVMASQTFPWFNKRGLRREVARVGTEVAHVDLERVRLSIIAEVERAYVDLLLVRDQLGLLLRLESLWEQSEGLARARYEIGETPQSDLLRAQLERNRLNRQRWSLEGEERRREMVLNRLCGQSLSDSISTRRSLLDLPDPALLDIRQSITAAETKSPELKRARLVELEANRRVDLAKRERWPDVTVNLGIMPRGNEFVTMWQAGIAVNVPIWSQQKQGRAILENQARGQMALGNTEQVHQLLKQRVHERKTVLEALLKSTQLYRSGLLIQSEATVKSTLAQYQVGRVTFASVLESLAGYLNDVNGYLQVIAEAQFIVIAEREMSLDAPGSGVPASMGGAAMPGTSASRGTSSSNSKQPQDTVDTGSSMSRM